VDLSYRPDGIRVLRPFLGAVALHPGEAECEAAGVVRAFLDVIEGDLDLDPGAVELVLESGPAE
jgi:hypothetical protein